MENMDIQIIKSRRRTVSIEVHTDGSVILRAPNRMTKKAVSYTHLTLPTILRV